MGSQRTGHHWVTNFSFHFNMYKKVSDDKYFMHCRIYILYPNLSNLLLYWKRSLRPHRNKWEWLCSIKILLMGTSLLVQGLHTSTAGSMGPIPSQGTKILHARGWGKKKKKHTLLIKQITGQIWSDGHSLKILDPLITNKFSRIFHSPFVFSGCDLEVNLIILLFFF